MFHTIVISNEKNIDAVTENISSMGDRSLIMSVKVKLNVININRETRSMGLFF